MEAKEEREQRGGRKERRNEGRKERREGWNGGEQHQNKGVMCLALLFMFVYSLSLVFYWHLSCINTGFAHVFPIAHPLLFPGFS